MSDLPIHRALSSASPVVYGCMGLGGSWDTRDITRAGVDTARRCIESALAAGITVFDHADIYARGKAESVFGAVLAESPGLRERMVIARKDKADFFVSIHCDASPAGASATGASVYALSGHGATSEHARWLRVGGRARRRA